MTTPLPVVCGRRAECCDERVLGMCVCLSTSISPEPLVRTSPYFLSMLLVAVAQSFSGGVSIRCILPVLWITPRLHIMAGNIGDAIKA